MRQALELRVSFDLVSLSLSLSGHRFWRFSVIGWLRMEVSDGGEVVAVLESSGTEPNEIISDRSDEGGAASVINSDPEERIPMLSDA